MNIHFAPIVFIGFNRPQLSRLTMGAAAKCSGIDKRDAFLFIDGPREGREDDTIKTKETQQVAEELRRTVLPQLQIIKRDQNLGCRGNIIASISEVINAYEKAIIIEDDVLVSRTFLDYLDEALVLYESDKRIWCINAYQNPNLTVPRSVQGDVYLTPRNMCWGWGTWKDRWNEVDFDMKDWPEFIKDPNNQLRIHNCDVRLEEGIWDQYHVRNTWDIQCTYHMVKSCLWAVEPRYSLTKNCGSGVEGTHCLHEVPQYTKQRYYNFKPFLTQNLKVDENLLRRYKFICTGKPDAVKIAILKALGKFRIEDERCVGFVNRVIGKLLSVIYASRYYPAHLEPCEVA